MILGFLIPDEDSILPVFEVVESLIIESAKFSPVNNWHSNVICKLIYVHSIYGASLKTDEVMMMMMIIMFDDDGGDKLSCDGNNSDVM